MDAFINMFKKDVADHAPELEELNVALTGYKDTLAQVRATLCEGIMMLALSSNSVSRAQALLRDELGEIAGGKVDDCRVHPVILSEANKMLPDPSTRG